MIFLFRIVIFTMLTSLFACVPIVRGDISQDRAVAIAWEEASDLGYDVESMELKDISKHSKPWNRYLPKDSKSKWILDMQEKLKGKRYVAVYLGHRKREGHHIKGGSICIFIDFSTGEVLATLKRK